jgi:hypothetical protein
VITWGNTVEDLMPGMEEDFTAVIDVKTLFWHIYTVEGSIAASGVGFDLPSSMHLVEQTMRGILGRRRIDKGSYPPGVPKGGG